MKQPLVVILVSLLCIWVARAESRVFTNKGGQEITAELLGMNGDEVVLRLVGDRTATVSVDSLCESDRAYIKSWWEENKNKVKAMDVRVTINKATDLIERKVDKPKGGARGGKGQQNVVVKKMTKDKTHFVCTLMSYTQKHLSDIVADYTIYKRTTTRDKDGIESKTDEINGSSKIARLESHGTARFETDAVECVDSSESGGKGPRLSKRETVEGIIVTLSAGGEEFLKQSYPENLVERLEEDEKRAESR